MGTMKTVPGMTPYACSKSALEQLAMQLRAELEAHGIKVHYFLPPPMETKFLISQRNVYPLVTQGLLKNQRYSKPSLIAKKLMRGISMNEFIIPGCNSINFLSTLKA
jgi:short-subunit dehydrogenase